MESSHVRNASSMRENERNKMWKERKDEKNEGRQIDG
jgi:hypothetical protein